MLVAEIENYKSKKFSFKVGNISADMVEPEEKGKLLSQHG